MNSSRISLLVWNFADPGIVPDDQFTGMKSTRLEIVGAARKQSPAADVLAHDSHRFGVREISVEALLKLGGDREPHAVRLRIGGSVA